jgi:uncharacterized protein YecT (DUF1311 family)
MTRPSFFAAILALPLVAAPFAAAQDIVPDPPAPAAQAQQPTPATQPAQATTPATPPAPRPAACAAILARPFDGGLDPRIQPDCDSSSFYFGIGRDKDYTLARACAFIERINHVDKDGSLFTGPGILSMVYANGEGTPRDLDLARRFTCEDNEASTAEIEGRLALIDKIAATPKDTPHFDLCATAKTATSWSWCTAVLVRQHDAHRYDEMVAIVDKLTPEGQEAFKKLQTAEGVFETARAEGEVDQNGLANAAWVLQEQDRLRATFVADLKQFNKPDFTQPVALAVVDAKMNEDYAKIRATASHLFINTTITLAGVDKAQAAWLKYRDAWRAYEGVVNPKLSGDAVATLITRERLYHLHKLLTP